MVPRVECYSGYGYAERPCAFYLEGQKFEVVEVLSQWRLPNGICFRVRTDQESFHQLNYDEVNEEWEILPLDE